MLLTTLLQLCHDQCSAHCLVALKSGETGEIMSGPKATYQATPLCQQTLRSSKTTWYSTRSLYRKLAQMGYNFLYGLWKYSWDADCELFLKILQEETKEDVYTQQIQLQASSFNPTVQQCQWARMSAVQEDRCQMKPARCSWASLFEHCAGMSPSDRVAACEG